MDAWTGERGPNAGRNRMTQSSGAGLGAVRALVEAEEDAYVPISIELATNCAPDALEVFEAVVNVELFVTERCVAIVCQGHGGARSMAWFSPTKWECIMRLIRQMAAAGHQRHVRLLARLDRILQHCIDARVYGIVAEGSANESCVLSSLFMVLLSERAAFFEGDSLARVEAVLVKCDDTLHCAYTNVVTKRVAGSYVVDLADHIAEFEREHGALLRRAAAITAPLRVKPLSMVHAIFIANVRMVDTSAGGRVPLLVVWGGMVCADMMSCGGAINMAAHAPLSGVLGVERGHIGVEVLRPPEFENDEHWLLHLAGQSLGGDPNIPRRGSHTFDLTLGLRADVDKKSVTYYGTQVGVLWPGPGRAAFARLLAARRGPFGFMDMYDAGARRAFFELYNHAATLHTGSQEPAKILAKKNREWRCL